MLSRNMGHKHYAVWNDTTLTFPEGEWYKVGLFFSTSPCRSRFFLNTTYIRALTCKGNPLRFRRSPVFRFRSRHLVSLPQRLRSNDILRHPLPTRFRSRSHDVA